MIKIKLVLKQAEKDLIFGKDILLSDICIEVYVLRMLFFPFFNTDMNLQRVDLEELNNAETISFGHYQKNWVY